MPFRVVRSGRLDSSLAGFRNIEEAIDWIEDSESEEYLVIIDREGTVVWWPSFGSEDPPSRR